MNNYLEIYDHIDKFLESIYSSKYYINYIIAVKEYNKNLTVQKTYNEILDINKELEKLKEKYTIYSKEYQEKNRQFNELKKYFFDIPDVVKLRYTERRLQNILDEVMDKISSNFSTHMDKQKNDMFLRNCLTCDCSIKGE